MITTLLPSITGILYLITAIAFACKHQGGFALTYLAYAIANVGLVWASLEVSGVRH